MEILVDVNILKAIAVLLGATAGFSITSTALLVYLIFYAPRPPQEKCYVLENKVNAAVTPEGKFKAFSPTEPEFVGSRE